MAGIKSRILRILIALDIFVFALITLGGSKRNETISAAAWDLEREGKWQGELFRPSIDAIFNLLDDTNHCQKAWLNEHHTYD